ncbi:MAG: 3-phosphoshikimate 1-carboxyvinyltransferase [Lawsonibacter sp.]|nr:3-phosphoshikimate 1-carboxyvinyltransferase [Lawsonibacter sp.]
MDLLITPRLLTGAVTPPPSKSQAHRALLALMLAGGEGRLSNLEFSQDIRATEDCVAALKAPGHEGVLPLLDCGESGSTLRFLIPVALALRGGAQFTGRGRLMERPQQPYFDLFDRMGIVHEQEEGTLTIWGKLTPGEYALPGNVSSQFVTGLLFALPLLEGDSTLRLTSDLESAGYVDMTLDVLQKFGVQVERPSERIFHIPGNQSFQARDLTIEADWSQAAFWFAANALGSSVRILGLDPASAQGDKVIRTHYAKLCKTGRVCLNLAQCPDLAPPLAAMAALRSGTTQFIRAGRLRIKESDRLASITATLNALGAHAEAGEDTLTIHGLDSLAGGASIDCQNDHRIAMMAAVAAIRCREPVVLLGADCVRKSYPKFWDHYRMLGGMADVVIPG